MIRGLLEAKDEEIKGLKAREEELNKQVADLTSELEA